MNVEHVERCEVCGGGRFVRVGRAPDVVRCAGCGFVFHTPRPTADEIVRFYATPGKYGHWLAEHAARERLWRRRLEAVRRIRPSGRLLDVGAGVGSFLRLAKAHYLVTGTEVSPEAIAVARERSGVTLLEGPIEDVTLDEASFDVITMFHVLEHVHHPARTLERCRSLLKPGGALIVAVPNEVDGLKHRLKRLAGRAGGLGAVTLDPTRTDEIHLSHFTAAVLARLLGQCGFVGVRDGLDRYYVSRGVRRAFDDTVYAACRGARRLGLRVYDAMWVWCERPASVTRKAG